MKVLMVCLGNICRSPLAHAILDSITSDKIKVDSAGTSNYHLNSAPDSRMIKKGLQHGLNLNTLRARQFESNDYKKFDLILAMDKDNYENIVEKCEDPAELHKVRLFLNNNENVPDPYFGKEDGFELVYQIIHEECQQLAKKIDV